MATVPVAEIDIRKRVWLLLGLVVMTGAASWARASLNAASGLRAEYDAESPTGRQERYVVDHEISPAAMAAAWGGSPPAHFAAHWSGFLVVARAGQYRFATTSDDGSTITIDGRVVVPNGGEHGPPTHTGSIQLRRGPHALLIDCSQAQAGHAMSWAWARGQLPLSPVPWWALWTRRTGWLHAVAARVLNPLPFLGLLACVGTGAVLLGQQFGGEIIAASTRTRGRRIVLRVVLTAASLAMAVASAEWAARLLFRHVQSSGDARTYFANRSGAARVNNVGFRDPDVAPSSGGRYRLIIVGDSITWGQGLAEEERFSNLIQHALGPGYEVVNLGTPAHDLPEHLHVLDQALTLSPNFILLQLYTNDFEIGGMQRPAAHRLLPWASVDSRLLKSSALYTMLSAQWPRVQVQLGLSESYEHYMFRYLGDAQSPHSRQAFGMLHDFVARAGAAGVPVGTVMFPNPAYLGHGDSLGYLHDRVQATCSQEQIRCVDLRQAFLANFHELKDIVVSPFDGHPSAAANRVAAEAILREFRPAWTARDRRTGSPGEPASAGPPTSGRTPSGASPSVAPRHAAAH